MINVQTNFPVAFDEEFLGSVSVRNIALDPFFGWQHTNINPLIIAKIAFLAQTAAFEGGWLDREGGNFFQLSKYESEPLHTEEAMKAAEARATTEFSTVFVVSMEAKLNQAANLSLRRRPAASMRLFVVHCGQSSFTLHTELECDGEHLGSVTMSFVHVDFSTRRPAPIPAAKKELLASAVQSVIAAPAYAALATPLPRIALPKLVAEMSQTSDFAMWEKRFVLRQSDFDFNLHLNQSMYQVFALDALKEAATEWAMKHDATVAATGVTNPGDHWMEIFCNRWREAPHSVEQHTLRLDSAVDALRIDYTQEIRMPSRKASSGDSDDKGAIPTTGQPPCVVSRVAPLREPAGMFLFTIALDTDSPSVIRAFGTVQISEAA